MDRNIKKVNANKRSMSKIHSNSIKSNGWGKFKFPIQDEVPEDRYVSRIMNVQETVTRKGEQAIAVFYKLESVVQCYKRVRNLLPDDYKKTYYHIKQVYPKEGQFFEDFSDAMSLELFGIEGCEFNIEDIIGIEEIIELSYTAYSKIGGISKRNPVNYEAFYGKAQDADK